MRPHPYSLSSKKIYYNHFPYFSIPIDYLNVHIIKHLDVLWETDGKGNWISPRKVKHEECSLYFGVQILLNHCVNNAETILNRMREYLVKRANSQDEKDKILGLDFMNMRSTFSEHCKKLDILRNNPAYDTKEKLKLVTTMFKDFIDLRNIYTHGRLIYLLPDCRLLIEHKTPNPDGKKGANNKTIEEIAYCEINTEILMSYNYAYKQLSVLFDIVVGMKDLMKLH